MKEERLVHEVEVRTYLLSTISFYNKHLNEMAAKGADVITIWRRGDKKEIRVGWSAVVVVIYKKC